MPIKVGFVSLGCPKNLINTEVMLAKLVDNGMDIVAEDIDGKENKKIFDATDELCEIEFTHEMLLSV